MDQKLGVLCSDLLARTQNVKFQMTVPPRAESLVLIGESLVLIGESLEPGAESLEPSDER